MDEEIDKRKEEIRERLSRKSKKESVEEELVDTTPTMIQTSTISTSEISPKEPEWKEFYIKGMSAVLQCEKCGNEIIDERRRTMSVGEKAYLYCKTCNMSFHHECIGYSVLVRKV